MSHAAHAPLSILRWCTLLCGLLFFAPRLHAGVNPDKVKALRQEAACHEQRAEWDKACLVYESILRLDRTVPEIQERYQTCLRRYWQVRRHTDPSYRKEILGMDYAQALRLYTVIRNTLLDNALDKAKVDPGQLFRKGLEEFDNALSDPYLVAQYLPTAKPRDIRAFRAFLKETWSRETRLTRQQAVKHVRDVTLAAQHALHLNASFIVMEFACGACYGIDEYTLYLTPNQLRELVDSLHGEYAGMFTPSVTYRMQSDRLGYLHIACFQESTVQEVDDALASLGKDGMKSLILDLRGNGGGLFESAIDVARRFLATGVIATTQNSDPHFSTVYQARNPNALTVGLVVLIDADTASAAEVLAGALKDNKRGRLVGQTTFGKGCTQCVLRLPTTATGASAGGIRLTVARFFSPDGVPYSGRGVVPNIVVDPHFMNSMSDMDPQMDAALMEAQRLLELP